MRLLTGKMVYTHKRIHKLVTRIHTHTHTLTQSHTSRKLGESLFSSAMLSAVYRVELSEPSITNREPTKIPKSSKMALPVT